MSEQQALFLPPFVSPKAMRKFTMYLLELDVQEYEFYRFIVDPRANNVCLELHRFELQHTNNDYDDEHGSGDDDSSISEDDAPTSLWEYAKEWVTSVYNGLHPTRESQDEDGGDEEDEEEEWENKEAEWDRCVGIVISLVSHSHLWLQQDIKDLNGKPMPIASRKVISPTLLLEAIASIDPKKEADPSSVLRGIILNMPAVKLEPGPWQDDERVQRWLHDLYRYGRHKFAREDAEEKHNGGGKRSRK